MLTSLSGFRMRNVTADAVSGGGAFASGFAGKGFVRDCTIKASGATNSYAINSNHSGDLTVINSTV